MITIDFLIALPLGGVVGWAIREIVSDRLARARTADTKFNKAAAEFRCAFTDELRLIADSTRDTDFEKIFNNAYIRHTNALIRFQASLSESERTEIGKAWEDHCKEHDSGNEIDGECGTQEITRFMHYEFKEMSEFNQAKQLASKNLENILSFAKFK